jgi:DnaK suppressor protein
MPGEETMNEKNLQRYKQKLLELRSRSREEMNQMIEMVLAEANEPPGEHDRKVSESLDKEVALEHTEEEIHQAVLEALQRIEDGTYGQCLECGTSIPEARLEAIPFAAYCVNCQRLQEG